MQNWVEALVVLLTLTNLVLLGSSTLGTCVRVVALQGVILGFLPILAHFEDVTTRVLVVAIITVLFKGLLLPGMLRWALKSAAVKREMEPFVGYSASILIGLGALGVSFWLGGKLPPTETAPLVVPGALFTIMAGLLLIVTRRKALSQALGYLVLENGIYVFGVAVSKELPLLVELGVLLDLFVAIFVMGIAIFHISREFNHINTDQMASLKG